MHNGLIREFGRVKRDLMLEVAPELYPRIEGTTDSEAFFHLALSYGLEQDPPKAVEQAVGLIEEVGREHGVEHPIQMTVATSDGTRIWAFRYSSEGDSRTLFYSTSIETLELMYPDSEDLRSVKAKGGLDARMVVSEPRQPGQDDLHSFTPSAPTRRARALA
jgi:glutamine amidotransferase